MAPKKISSGQYKVVATGFLSLFSLVGIMFYGLPFFFDFWVKDFGWSRATVTSGNALGGIVGALFGPVAGWLIDRYGPRRLMLSGILMGGIALIALSRMQALWQFYLFYALSSIGYMCGAPLPNQVLTARWFDKSRGKAMGIAYLGIGFGGMLVPQLARWLNRAFGWHEALLTLGILMIVLAFPMAWFVRDNPQPARPDISEAPAPGTSQPPVSGTSRPSVLDIPSSYSRDTSLPSSHNIPPAPAHGLPLNRILRSSSFYLLALGSVCSIAAVASISQHLKLFLSLDLKYTQARSANVISLVLTASILGRLLMGWLADKLSKRSVMMLIYALVAGSIALLYFAASPGIIYVFAFVFGIGLGGEYMIIPLMAAELFGIKPMGRVMGVILTADGLSIALAPLLVGWLRDHSGNYSVGFAVLILLAAIGTIAVAMLPRNAGSSHPVKNGSR
jgi:sugar phosphate permease